MTKYIHYCWFGEKPLPKLAKKCIKSWEKYLPDYEIKCWNETNSNLEECPFVKEAYENKKWAFVADYVRTKAMYEYGGIYFDTDMEITKNIDLLLENEMFLGVEDSGYIACGVWYSKNPKSLLAKEMLKFYKSQLHFNVDDMYSISIPKIITNILINEGYDSSKTNDVQILDNGMHIYPRDYFYPLSYDHHNNVFTDNTCMIHYYDATWTSKWEKRENKIFRIFGKKNGRIVINILRKTKKVLTMPVYLYRKHKNKKSKKELIEKEIMNVKDLEKIALYNPTWLGIASATKELFDNTLPLPELYNNEFKLVAKLLSKTKVKLLVLSGISPGWIELIEEIKSISPNIKIKVLWHGSNAMNVEEYDWKIFKKVFDLLEGKVINSIGFVKKSMFDLYKSKGYNVEFVMNNVNISNYLGEINKHNNVNSSNNTKIGIYASGDRWVKNFYNQLAAASLIKNANIDCVPLSNKTVEFAKILKVNVNGSYTQIDRKKLLERMSENDINLYVTFVECAPSIPLESFELGIPCITSGNHHYWENTELEKYLIVDKNDNPIEISKKINYCLENKEKIIEMYKKWKKDYDKKAKNNNKKFLE